MNNIWAHLLYTVGSPELYWNEGDSKVPHIVLTKTDCKKVPDQIGMYGIEWIIISFLLISLM